MRNEIAGRENGRVRIAQAVRGAALVAFGAALALSPLSYHWVLLASPMTPVYHGYTDLQLYPGDVAALAALLLWSASLAVAPRALRLRPLALTIPLGALTLAAFGSAAFSAAPGLALYHAGRLAVLFALYLFVANEVHDLWIAALPAGVLVLTQSAIGIGQVVQQGSLGLGALGELALDPRWSGVSIVWAAGTRWLRAYGLSDHPNILGGCLACALLLLVAVYPRVRPGARLPVAALVGLGAAGLLVTFSRSAWLGLAAALGLLVIWLARAGRRAEVFALSGLGAAVLVVVLPLALVAAAPLSSRLDLNGSFSASTPENQSLNERALLSVAALRMLWGHPLTGVGVGVFPVAFYLQNPGYPFDYQPPHLVLLDVAAETGVLGAVSYAALSLAPWALLVWQRNRLRFSLPLAAVSALLLAVTVISLLDYYPWMLAAGQIWQWSIWGLWGGAHRGALHA